MAKGETDDSRTEPLKGLRIRRTMSTVEDLEIDFG